MAVRDRSGNEVRGVPFEPFLGAVAEEATDRALAGIDLEELLAASGPKPTA